MEIEGGNIWISERLGDLAKGLGTVINHKRNSTQRNKQISKPLLQNREFPFHVKVCTNTFKFNTGSLLLDK